MAKIELLVVVGKSVTEEAIHKIGKRIGVEVDRHYRYGAKNEQDIVFHVDGTDQEAERISKILDGIKAVKAYNFGDEPILGVDDSEEESGDLKCGECGSVCVGEDATCPKCD